MSAAKRQGAHDSPVGMLSGAELHCIVQCERRDRQRVDDLVTEAVQLLPLFCTEAQRTPAQWTAS
jgi:hypothetical protein